MASRLLWRRSATAAGIYGSTALGILGAVVVLRVLGPTDAGRFSLAVRGNEQCDRLADGLRGRVAEETLRTFVPAGDEAVKVLADDRVFRRLNNGT